MYSWSYQEYIRTRVGNSRSFCYESAVTAEFEVRHHYQRQSVLKKEKTFILERCARRWTLYFDEHVHAKCRPSLKCQSKRWSFCKFWSTCSALSAQRPEIKWKESGCASTMTNLEFCRDRPHSMELPTLVLMYSWSYGVEVRTLLSGQVLHLCYEIPGGWWEGSFQVVTRSSSGWSVRMGLRAAIERTVGLVAPRRIDAARWRDMLGWGGSKCPSFEAPWTEDPGTSCRRIFCSARHKSSLKSMSVPLSYFRADMTSVFVTLLFVRTRETSESRRHRHRGRLVVCRGSGLGAKSHGLQHIVLSYLRVRLVKRIK